MRPTIVGVLGLFLLIRPAWGNDNDKEGLIRAAIETAYNLRFDEATKLFHQLIENDPEHPYPYLLQGINYYYRYQLDEDYETHEQDFLRYAKRAIELSRKRLGDEVGRLDALFYAGMANMYLAAYYGWESNWLKAYWYGKEGIDNLQRVVSIDPSYFDAYLGLGIYHYYTGILPKYVRPLTFLLGLDSDQERGLRELKLAADHSTYSRAEAMLFLGNIHLYVERDFETALPYFQKLCDRYPRNPSFLMLLGENYQKLKMDSLAVASYRKIITDPLTRRFPVLLASSYYRLGNLHLQKREFRTALKQYKKAIERANRSTGNVRWLFAWANLNLGKTYDLLGLREKAVGHYKKVQKSDHKRAYDLAQQQIRDPIVKPEQHYAANGSFSQTRYQKIIRIYKEALLKTTDSPNDLRPEHIPEMQYHIAKAFYEERAYNAAINKLKRILTSSNVREQWLKPWSNFYLANCYLKLGELNKARSAYQTAYQFDDEQLRSAVTSMMEGANLAFE